MFRNASDMMERLCTVGRGLAVVALLANPSLGHADNGFKAVAEGGITAAYIGELLLPDFRLSFQDGKRSWVMSFPIVPASANLRFANGKTVALQPTLEPQYQFNGSHYRLAGQVRAVYFNRDASEVVFAPLLELGAVTGTDGSGGFVGAGFGFTIAELGPTLAVVARESITTQGNRFDLAVDLSLPWSCNKC